MIYIYVALLSALISFFIYMLPIQERLKYKIQLISFIPLTILGAIRYYVGIDYTTYSKFQLPQLFASFKNVKFEFLSEQVAHLGYLLSGRTNYFWIFALFHVIFMLFMAWYIIKQSPNIPLSLFFLVLTTFFAFSLSGMRQAIGTSIVLAGLYFLSQKKVVIFTIFVGIATLFHSSSIIYLIFIPLIYIKISLFIQFIIFVFALFMSRYGMPLVSSLMIRFNFFSEYVGGRFYTGAYSKYFLVLVVIVYFTNLFLIYSKDYYKEEHNSLYLNINFIMVIVGIMMPAIPTPERIVYMFLPIQIVLVPKIIYNIKDAQLKVIVTILYLIIFGMFYTFVILIDNRYMTLPYRSIFDVFGWGY